MAIYRHQSGSKPGCTFQIGCEENALDDQKQRLGKPKKSRITTTIPQKVSPKTKSLFRRLLNR